MIGHDQVDAQTLRRVGSGKGADPGIHADDQTDARGGSALDDVIFHAIPFADAVGHMKIRSASAKLDRRLEDDDGGGAVDVVVAVDQDALFAFDGCIQAIDCGLHAAHCVG